jgi:hypothetical protein
MSKSELITSRMPVQSGLNDTEEQIIDQKAKSLNLSAKTSIHPLEQLRDLANNWNIDLYSSEFANKLDQENVWPHLREKFHYPKLKDLTRVDLNLVENKDDECVYLTGNSLGLQPKSAKDYVNRQFDKWAKMFSIKF